LGGRAAPVIGGGARGRRPPGPGREAAPRRRRPGHLGGPGGPHRPGRDAGGGRGARAGRGGRPHRRADAADVVLHLARLHRRAHAPLPRLRHLRAAHRGRRRRGPRAGVARRPRGVAQGRGRRGGHQRPDHAGPRLAPRRARGAALTMRVVRALSELDLKGVVLTIGNFDGVHRGHRRLLERVRELAASEGAPSVVVTFFPPARVVFGSATYLSSEEEKLALLAEYDPTAVVMVPFSREFARTDKAAFVDELRRLAPHTVVVGEDFRFGRGREGNLNDLTPIARRLEAFGLVTFGGE